MTSIREVAEQAGVSLGTVSNVLNRPEIVAPATRERVQAVIKQLGFVRNASAHQLRAGQSRYIGLIVLDIRNPFFTEVARGVEDAAIEAGYVVILCNSDVSSTKEKHYLRLLQEQRPAGILITPVQDDITYLQKLYQQGTAVVLLDRLDHTKSLCSVAIDDIRGGELATRHLLELGHRRLALVSGPLSIRQCAERRQGMLNAIKAYGLDPQEVLKEIIVSTQNHIVSGEVAIETLIEPLQMPTATLCTSDLLALEVLKGLTQRGIPVPEKMSLVGYDDVEFVSMLSPSLTSIRQPKYQIGRTAAELLLQEITQKQEHCHRQIIYQPELVIRASTKAPSETSSKL